MFKFPTFDAPLEVSLSTYLVFLLLPQCNWVSRRADQGPKTIEQIHKEAKIEEQEEQRKVQQLMTKDKRRPGKVKAKLAAPFTHFSSSGLRRESHIKGKNLDFFFPPSVMSQGNWGLIVAEAGKGTDWLWGFSGANPMGENSQPQANSA